MIEIPITPYCLLDGRQKIITRNVDDKYSDALGHINALECNVAMEILTTGEVSVTLEHEVGDLFIEVVPNGPEVEIALLKILDQCTYGGIEHAIDVALDGDEE